MPTDREWSAADIDEVLTDVDAVCPVCEMGWEAPLDESGVAMVNPPNLVVHHRGDCPAHTDSAV